MVILQRATSEAKTRAILGSLKEAQIIDSKPYLPAELLSTVLDYLAVADLLKCARVSKRMKEMVYEDARWVKRLREMGCWDELAARARHEGSRQRAVADWETRAAAAAAAASNNTAARTTLSTDDANQRSSPRTPRALDVKARRRSSLAQRSSLDVIGLSPTSPSAAEPPSPMPLLNRDSVLEVLGQVRSIRGAARPEYGRVYAALHPFYADAVRSKHPAQARVFRIYRDPAQQARMLAQLVRFAKSDFSPGSLQREKRLAFMVSTFEDAVTQEFHKGLQASDVDGRMKQYAHALVLLNGGQRAIDLFLSENRVLRDGMHLGDPMDCFAPASPDVILLEESQAFFGHLSAAFNAQTGIIDRSFPPTANVLVRFLQSVKTDLLAPYVQSVLDLVRERKTEAFVRAVPGLFGQAIVFAESLRPTKQPEVPFPQAVHCIIFDLFTPYVPEYLAEELALFRRKSETEVTGWERQLHQQDISIELLYMSHVNRQADKRDFLSSFKKMITAPVNALPIGRSNGQAANADESMDGRKARQPPGTRRSHGYHRTSMSPPSGVSRDPSPLPDPPSDELEAKAAILKSRLEGIRTLFSLEVALSLVQMAKISIERAATLARTKGPLAENARKQCESIFILLLHTLGERHVKRGFDQAIEHLSKYNPRETEDRQKQPGVTPLVIFLELVNVGDLIQQMLDVFYEQELVATRLVDRSDYLNSAVKEKKRFEQMLDESVASGLNKGIEVLMTEVDHILSTTQKVEDFNPGAAGNVVSSVMDIRPTDTATWTVDVLAGHSRMLVGSAEKNILDVFNQEVGLRLFAALCKHIKRQRISLSGAIRLISDLNHYFAFVQSLKNRDLLQYFRALREVSQLYLVSPDDAKELAVLIADSDRFKGIFRAEEVYEFAERRADWYQIKQRVEKAMYGIGCIVM